MGELRGLLIRVFAGVGLCTATAAAVDGTVFRESFVPVPVDAKVDQRIEAYIPLYRRMLPLVEAGRPISPIDLRRLSDDWISASQSGKLLPIEASFYGENFEDSPKGTFVIATMRVADQLHEVAKAELANGRLDDAVADAIRASAMLDSVRFASPDTMVLTATIARRNLSLAANNIQKVKTLPQQLVRQLELNQHAAERYQAFIRRTEQLKLLYTVRYGNEDTPESGILNFSGARKTDAQKFYSIDRERTLAKSAQACQFATGSQIQ